MATTFQDIANYCGVSTATVSNVIRNKGRVSVATRAKVLNAVDDLGYVYNQIAANLRNTRSKQIGLIIPDIQNPFYAGVTAGLARHLEKNGYTLFLASCEEDLERQQYFVDALHQNSSAGIVFCEARNTSPTLINTLENRQMPMVQILRSVGNSNYDFVGIDNVVGGRLATEHLLQLGHRHIAFIGGEANSKTRALRLEGYNNAMKAAGCLVPEGYHAMSTKKGSRLEGYHALVELRQSYPKLTAAVCYDDLTAIGVMRAADSIGLKPGKGFSVIGFDDIPEASDILPALTTISASSEIGEKAGEILFERIFGDTSPKKHLLLPPRLIERESCAAI